MTEREARNKARSLKKELGPSWTTHVWDGVFGYHYELISEDGYIHVSKSGDRKNPVYFVYISDTWGKCYISWSGRKSTYAGALRSAVNDMSKDLIEMNKNAKALTNILKKVKNEKI